MSTNTDAVKREITAAFSATSIELDRKSQLDPTTIQGIDPNIPSAKSLNPSQEKLRAINARDEVYAQFKEKYGIDIIKQDKNNREALHKRLANLEGPLTLEMRKFLTEKLQIKTKKENQENQENPLDQILTAEELRVFNLLIEAPWQLNYQSPFHNKNIEKGEEIISPVENLKKGKKHKKRVVSSRFTENR